MDLLKKAQIEFIQRASGSKRTTIVGSGRDTLTSEQIRRIMDLPPSPSTTVNLQNRDGTYNE